MKAKGFSLVELLIAMVLGLVLSGGVASLYVANMSNFALTNAMSATQENGNFALHFIEQHLASSKVGNALTCDGDAKVANAVWDGRLNAPFDANAMFGSGGIRGYQVGEGETGFRAGIDLETLTPNSDFIVFTSIDLVDNEFAVRVAEHDDTAFNFELNTALKFNAGKLMAVVQPDCSQVGIFVASNDVQGTNVAHLTGSNDHNQLSNCSTSLFGEYQCTSAGIGTTTGGELAGKYQQDAIVASIEHSATAFALKPVGNGLNSLYRINTATQEEVELVRGVAEMRLSYGMNTDPTNTGRPYVGRYMSAAQINNQADDIDWSDLLAVKISIDVTSENELRQADGSLALYEQTMERIFAVKSKVMR